MSVRTVIITDKDNTITQNTLGSAVGDVFITPNLPSLQGKLNASISPKHEFHILMRSDEVLDPQFLSRSMQIFDTYKVGAIYTDYTGPLGRQFLPPYDRKKMTKGTIIPLTCIFRTKFITEFDEYLQCLESLDFWLMISEKCPVWHIPENLYYKNGDEEAIDSKEIDRHIKYIFDKAEKRMRG